MRTTWLAVAIALAMTSCTAADPYARVNPVTYLCSNSGDPDDARVCPSFQKPGTSEPEVIEPRCVFWQKSGPVDRVFSAATFGESSSTLDMCFYERAYVNETEVDKIDRDASEPVPTPQSTPEADPATSEPGDTSGGEQADFRLKRSFENQRNEIIDDLLNISDSNCNNFLNRLFAKQTGVSFAKGLVNVVTSASAALTGFASVPAAAALNAGNASLGGGLDAINTDMYYSKTAPDIAQAIRNKRAQLREDITLRELGTTAAAIGAKAAEGAKAKADALRRRATRPRPPPKPIRRMQRREK